MLKLGGWPRLTWGRDAVGGASVPPSGASDAPGVRSERLREPSSTTQRRADAPRRGGGNPSSISARRAPKRPVGQFPPSDPRARVRGGAVRDAQAGVPSAGWPRAQLAFKDSMVRGILQFTPSIAFRYVLHRCESRDIRCRESSKSFLLFPNPPRGFGGREGAPGGPPPVAPPPPLLFRVLGANRAVGASVVRRARPGAGAAAGGPPSPPRPASSRCRVGRSVPPSPMCAGHVVRGSTLVRSSTMILPQVHLRKPCYDFSFL
jgi:hypothetical protein